MNILRSRPRAASAVPEGSGARPAETVRPHSPPSADAAEIEERIRVAAYFLAEQRGFGPGHELDDWCAAEAMLRARAQSSPERAAVATRTDVPSQHSDEPR